MTNNQLAPESVTRFTQYGVDMIEWPDGAYVKYEDYAALAAELYERRKAERDSEPVAWLWSRDGDDERDVSLTPPDDDDDAADAIECGWTATPLYRHAQQPVVPDRSIFEKWWESQNGAPLDGWDSLRATDGYCDDGIDGQFEAWNACRAAMLQGAKNSESRCGIQTAPALDSLPKNAESRSGNSPVIPDGYVMVPKEPTKEMIDAGWLHFTGTKNPSSKGTYKAMLAAAPQEVK